MLLVERQAEVREEEEGFNPPVAVSRVRLAAEGSPLAANRSAKAAADGKGVQFSMELQRKAAP